ATGMLVIRHANDTQWVVPELVPEFHRRGLDVEGGGHAMVELLPRTLFGEHPEYFPVARDGRRSDLGNVCVSSPEALAVVSERARAARAAIPGATDLHLWGLDLFGGGWCAFGGCATPLVEVIARDLESYAAAGVRGVSCLLFGSYSLWAYGVNVEAFARGMLRPDTARGAREAYSRRWYGKAAEPMGRYLARLERLVAGPVQHGDVRLPPRARHRARAAHDALAAIV